MAMICNLGWKDATSSGALLRGDTWVWPMTYQIAGQEPGQDPTFTGTPLITMQNKSGRIVASSDPGEDGTLVPIGLDSVQGFPATNLEAGILTFHIKSADSQNVSSELITPKAQVIWCGEPLTFIFPTVKISRGVL